MKSVKTNCYHCDALATKFRDADIGRIAYCDHCWNTFVLKQGNTTSEADTMDNTNDNYELENAG